MGLELELEIKMNLLIVRECSFIIPEYHVIRILLQFSIVLQHFSPRRWLNDSPNVQLNYRMSLTLATIDIFNF